MLGLCHPLRRDEGKKDGRKERKEKKNRVRGRLRIYPEGLLRADICKGFCPFIGSILQATRKSVRWIHAWMWDMTFHKAWVVIQRVSWSLYLVRYGME